MGLSRRKIQKLISKSRITDLRNGGQYARVVFGPDGSLYGAAPSLFWPRKVYSGLRTHAEFVCFSLTTIPQPLLVH